MISDSDYVLVAVVLSEVLTLASFLSLFGGCIAV